jgi:hypothetical protein
MTRRPDDVASERHRRIWPAIAVTGRRRSDRMM